MAFPNGFLWGAASSAYQVEGGAAADGRGPSVWDVFAHSPGKTWEGHTGDIACDHYNRFRDDVGLMKQIGLQAYRFSVSWSRVLPEGTGRINERGLGFYDKLVDELLTAGIQPWLTLFHWDYPYHLFKRGGWLNRESVEWFGEYAQVLVDRLSDRVSHWMTLNEPQCYIGGGPEQRPLQPGWSPTFSQRLSMIHQTLMAHGRGVQVIRARAKTKPSVGWAPCGVTSHPVSNSEQDIIAARLRTTTVVDRDLWNNAWYSDPVCLGQYPETGLRLFGSDVPQIQPGDLELMHQPMDFYGINIYNGQPTRMGAKGPEKVERPVGFPKTAFHWPIEPESLYWGPKFVYERYRIPMYITENGLSCADVLSLDEQVHDPQRIDFTTRYLRALRQATEEGTDVRGYFHWSIIDNFEWEEGYKQRFGLVFVDYPTQRRVLKDSAKWYSGVIQSNGGVI